jgi:hypothetical protein
MYRWIYMTAAALKSPALSHSQDIGCYEMKFQKYVFFLFPQPSKLFFSYIYILKHQLIITEMGRAWRMHGTDEKYIQNFVQKT